MLGEIDDLAAESALRLVTAVAIHRIPVVEALKGSLTGSEPPRSETAKRLGLSEGALKVAVHRLRKDFRRVLRAEITETVADPSEIDDELRHLVTALREK